MHQLLPDIGVAVLAATLLGLVAHWTRQPIILGYLVAGAAIGPRLGFSLVHDQASIEVISEMGLILLLFIIGLEMNIKALLASGKQLLVAGFGQFILCALLGVALFASLGYGLKGERSDGLYLAFQPNFAPPSAGPIVRAMLGTIEVGLEGQDEDRVDVLDHQHAQRHPPA